MQDIALYIHIGVGILLILFILVQDKGVGFGTAVGGVGGGSGFYATQRGAAKVLHRLTVFLAAVYLAAAVIYVTLPSPPDTAPTAPAVNSSATGTTGDVPVTINNAEGEPIEVDATPSTE